MKKLLLSSIAIGSCLLLVGCGTSTEDAAVTNLSNQIDRLNNVIANSSVVSTTSFDLSNYSNGNKDVSGIRNIYQKTSNAIKEQEFLKDQIRSKNAIIKNKLASKDLKLGKDAGAIKELANSLSKYTTKLTNTNNEYRKTSSSLARMSNSNSSSEVGARLTRLSSCCDSRLCYYNNILNTLNQIESILNGGAIVVENGNLNNDYLKNYLSDNFSNCLYDSNGKCIDGAYCQNGNCYDSNGNCINGYCFDSNGNCVNGNCTPNRAYYQNGSVINNQNIANRNSNMPYNSNYNYNAPYGYRNNRFNPNRNTDTYGPGITNIDTYRNNGYAYNYGFRGNGFNEITNDKNFETNSEIFEQSKDKTIALEEDKINETKETDKIDTLINNEQLKRDPNATPKYSRENEKSEEKIESNTLKLNPDYQRTNKKIKDLIQSSAPITDDLSQNMLVL